MKFILKGKQVLDDHAKRTKHKKTSEQIGAEKANIKTIQWYLIKDKKLIDKLFWAVNKINLHLRNEVGKAMDANPKN
jgi:hypothetical protein